MDNGSRPSVAHAGIRVAAAPPRPLLLFDGDCGFCRMWIARWKEMTGERVDYEPSQAVAGRYPEIPPEAFAGSVVFIRPDGSAVTGARAVFEGLAEAPGRRWPLRLYRTFPPIAWATEAAYARVARHRVLFSRLTRLVWGRSVGTPRFRIGTGLLLRGVGIVYAVAFASLWVQVRGLIGSHGILPAAPFLEAARAQAGLERFWLAPTLFWWSCSDTALAGVCAAGTALGLLAAAGLAQRYAFALLWVFYLSLVTAARVFLGFQWDNLLLEAGLLSILLAPATLRPTPLASWEPPRAALWAARFLLFRLMLASGIVKLASGDPTWRHLTALTWHYETQPLPNPLSWYMHHLPAPAHAFTCFLMFGIELGAPFLILGPGRLRWVAFVALAGLQLGFGVTGNYGFFNLLTIALCLPLLDDAFWRGGRPVASPLGEPGEDGRGRAPARSGFRTAGPVWRKGIVAPVVTVAILVGAVHLADSFRMRIRWPRPVVWLVEAISPARSVNAYGLFAVMTTSRPEIIVEGSRDATHWEAYEFRWKPGDPDRRPPWAGPYMPRLDWQMWFAALGDRRSSPWTQGLFGRLLQGEPEVLALLARNPFPQAPPRYLRARLYDYRFSGGEATPPAGNGSGAAEGSPAGSAGASLSRGSAPSSPPEERGRWWTRRQIGEWLPVVSLQGPRTSGRTATP